MPDIFMHNVRQLEQQPNEEIKADITSVGQTIAKPNVVRRLKCWLGFHDWVNIDTNPTPNPKTGEMICWSELHECSRCKKQEYKGMGCVV